MELNGTIEAPKNYEYLPTRPRNDPASHSRVRSCSNCLFPVLSPSSSSVIKVKPVKKTTNNTQGTMIKYKNRKRMIRSVKKWFKRYCETTSLHGFRYITAFKPSTLESIFWFLISASAIIFCIILMLRVWYNFSNNPTVTVIDFSSPISDMPFPAVTICNNNKVYKPHADYIAEQLSRYGFDDNMSNKLFSSLMKLIRPDTIEIDNATAMWALDILGLTVDKLMYKLMQPCSSLLVRCAWLGQVYDCSKIFKTVKSNEGFCCGFNYHFDLSSRYRYNSTMKNVTYADENFPEMNKSNPLPGVDSILNVPGAGRDVGLAVALNVEGDKYKSSVRQYIGATVLIHDALDYPDIGVQSSTVLPGHVLAVAVGGTGIESSSDLRSISLEKRMCLFDGEYVSRGDTQMDAGNYSYQTCISECMHKRVESYCNCLPFFYPQRHPDTRTCYLTDIACILSRRQRVTFDVAKDDQCDCLPQCNDKTYDVSAESVKIDNIGYESQITRNLTSGNISFVYVYFRDGTYLMYRRHSIVSWDGLLASFGGIFGLCLGGSVISLVEFLYHLAAEFFDSHKRKQSRKSFPPASKIFLSAPPKESLKEESFSGRNDNRLFFLWNEKLHHPIQNRSGNGTIKWDSNI